MMQLSLVTFSVVFLVMSGNLLTAFIGWQLIGFNLYWLLNPYHYDEYTNRAAKKKFVINRIGDMSFLLAVIFCLYFYSTTDFSVILAPHSPVLHIFDMDINARTFILACVFIAVMSKSAQFPFPIIYGSGNKMLHNVLSGLGVMEGNFSDLKIGLPWQSIAFRDKILHEPLRLLVIIYAPKLLVESLLSQHPSIKALFTGQWAHLKIIEPRN